VRRVKRLAQDDLLVSAANDDEGQQAALSILGSETMGHIPAAGKREMGFDVAILRYSVRLRKGSDNSRMKLHHL
jgi:hypothetical protein